jgi:hypothetical protein
MKEQESFRVTKSLLDETQEASKEQEAQRSVGGNDGEDTATGGGQ